MTGYDRATELVQKSHAVASLESAKGYLHFLSHVVVDAQPNKRPFRSIAEGWQWDRARRTHQAIDHACGLLPDYSGPLSFWNGYHKGSDKTHDTAREICYILGWSRKRMNVVICAGSEDQAALITAAMTGILQDNPWVAERVHVTELTAWGDSGSELQVLPMKAYTSQGVFPDYVVAEEVTHWQHDEGKKFWDFILSSVNKRPNCILKVNTNAGHVGSWQWQERNRVSSSKYWSFYEAPEGDPLPTWMNKSKIDDDSQGMSPGERKRLYANRWVDPGEEFGYLTMEDCERCVDITRAERTYGAPYTEYFAVIDYGGVHDRCALAVMHSRVEMRPPSDDGPTKDTLIHVEVDRLDCWQGSHESRVPIMLPENADGSYDYTGRSVEGWLEIALRNFRIQTIVVDPHQLEGLAIKYERRGKRVERIQWRKGQKNHRMAQLLKTCVQNRTVTWSPDAGFLPGAEDDTLSKELARLVIKEMAYGYKFDHTSGRHDDRAFCVASGLAFAIPEAKPGEKKGMEAVRTYGEPVPLGQRKSVVTLGGDDQAKHWNLFGMGQAGGSAWERGDISGR